MMHTRVKICGMTRSDDTVAAVRAGADALGFVFVPASPRCLSTSDAASLVDGVPAFVSRFGLFQDQDVEQVARILDQVPLNVLQFHGSEPADFCRQFGLPYVKAVRMTEPGALESAEQLYSDASALLLDSHSAGTIGGTGRTFDWSLIIDSSMPLIIAGGLGPENVFELVRTHRPWGVDVSSGVESRPGIKDHDLISKFMSEVDRGNRDSG